MPAVQSLGSFANYAEIASRRFRGAAAQISRVVPRFLDFSALSRFSGVDCQPIFPNLQAHPAKETHVDVGEPYQREACDEIASPVIEQQRVTGCLLYTSPSPRD